MDNIYETPELKLAALLVATVPTKNINILERENSDRKTIQFTYDSAYAETVTSLEKDFLNKEAQVSVYLYNRALNKLRNCLKDSRR